MEPSRSAVLATGSRAAPARNRRPGGGAAPGAPGSTRGPRGSSSGEGEGAGALRARDAIPDLGAPPPAETEALIVGAGFGGLGAALALAERGVRVTLCEALTYPGGCASTFARDGYAFEAGATLFSGFDEGQLLGRWIERHGMDVTVDRIDPLIELRTPSFSLAVPRSRVALVDRLAALPGSPPREALERFFALQRKVADATWALLDAPELLPPLDVRSLVSHLARLPRLRPVLATALKPLSRVLRDYGLDGPSPFRTYVDALCQITVQCSADEAEAPFALGAMDYCFRGTGHVRGGIGRLAWAMVDAIRALGGEVRFGCRVNALEPHGRGRGRPRGWRAETRLGPVLADAVVANALPRALESLVGRPAARAAKGLDDLAGAVETGWGACMLYAVVELPAGAAPDAAHLELIQDERAPLRDGNHLFCSLSGAADAGRAPAGQRTLTVSTHVSVAALRDLDEGARAAEVERIQRHMREGLRALAPEWERGIVHAFSASPRTFERFTGRPEGLVGGVPRRTGLACYRGLWPREVLPRMWLVGDSVFPGQSTLACAIGGHRAAASAARALVRR